MTFTVQIVVSAPQLEILMSDILDQLKAMVAEVAAISAQFDTDETADHTKIADLEKQIADLKALPLLTADDTAMLTSLQTALDDLKAKVAAAVPTPPPGPPTP